MNTQSTTVDPELAQWMLDRVRDGSSPQAMLEAMLARGWEVQAAMDAMEQTLRGHVEAAQLEQALPKAAQVPNPVAINGQWEVQADGHRVQVLANMLLPRVVVFGGLLSAEECDGLIDLARSRLSRSQTMNLDTGEDQTVTDRTSEGMFFEREETELVARIERRIERVLEWPLVNGEAMQVLRYGPGAEYRPHHDYFDPARVGTAETLKRGGQRVASLVMYLNTPEEGGATTFPDAHFEVGAVRGNAVFFSYDRPHEMTRTRHAGAPVVKGEKWVATKWLREREHA